VKKKDSDEIVRKLETVEGKLLKVDSDFEKTTKHVPEC